jgi:putative hydrolase of the HAD superfamily
MTGPVQPALTLLFDLGGVLYEAATVETLNTMLGTALSADVLKDRCLRSPAMRAFESGRIAPDRFATEFLREWQIPLAPDAFLADFAALVKQPYRGAEKLLERLRAKYTVSCLSNSNELHWRRLGGFLDCFDSAFSSHLLGETKPDESVFRRVMSELQVEPDRLLFFDDSRLNVEAAAKLGIGAFLVDGLDDTRRVLQQEGLL